MVGQLGFSYVGLIYMLMLEIPNILWVRNKPAGYDASNESKTLRLFERVGQVLCTATVLLFSDYNPRQLEPWTAWLVVSTALMIIYEMYWIRYFRSTKTINDFYRSFLGVPVPGATLPVTAFLLLGIYGKVIWLIISSIILGIGHIGIHIQHLKEKAKR